MGRGARSHAERRNKISASPTKHGCEGNKGVPDGVARGGHCTGGVEFLARMWKEMYEREGELRREHNIITLPPRVKKAIRLHARQSIIERWCAHLSDPQTVGQRTVGAIRPCLQEWVDRAQGEVTYRMT